MTSDEIILKLLNVNYYLFFYGWLFSIVVSGSQTMLHDASEPYQQMRMVKFLKKSLG